MIVNSQQAPVAASISPLNPELKVSKAGLYRLTVNYNGKTAKLSEGIKININRKFTLPGGVIWYVTNNGTCNIVK